MSLRRSARAALFFGMGVLFLSLLPWTRQAWEVNMSALRALAVCNRRGEAVGLERMPDFLRAGAAKCLGEEAAMLAAYRRAVIEPGARLPAIMAAIPDDAEAAHLAVGAHPTRAESHFWAGRVLAQAGDVPGAIRAYEAALSINGSEGNGWVALGHLYEQQGDWQRAVAAFEEACRLVDAGKNGCVNAGRLYLAHGMYPQAEARYRDALVQLPGYSPALWGLSRALMAMGREAEALPHLEALAESGDAEAQALLEQLQGIR